MIYSGISASEITEIFITHFHGDHCLGLPSILQRLSLDRVQHPVQIYFPASGQNFFDNIRGVSSYYDTAFIEPHPIDQEEVIVTDDKLTIRTERLEHTVETFGYRIEEQDSVNLIQDNLYELGYCRATSRNSEEKYSFGRVQTSSKMLSYILCLESSLAYIYI